MSVMAKLAHFVAFQIGWFACVVGAGTGHPLAGTIVALAVMHVALAGRPRSEFGLLLGSASIGAVWDSLLAASWALLTPLLLRIALRLDGFAASAARFRMESRHA
ncbi:MAG: DUF2878 family protein [Casimicrobiaceae bacterium]